MPFETIVVQTTLALSSSVIDPHCNTVSSSAALQVFTVLSLKPAGAQQWGGWNVTLNNSRWEVVVSKGQPLSSG